jgi:LysR family transcriptional regulator, chromosome initiation inhibitor
MLDPKQMEALAAAVKKASLTQAAHQLHITVGAISQRISALEKAVGQTLLIRGKQIRPTPAANQVLKHFEQIRLLESDLQRQLFPDKQQHMALTVATNADSLAAWFLPGVAAELQRSALLLNVLVDDQEHTLKLLQEGAVVGCITTEKKVVPGCVGVNLGVMQYHCVASPSLKTQLLAGAKSIAVQRLLQTPAVCFNARDGLQDLFLKQHFGLTRPQYPRHNVPAVDGFHQALRLGLGWGMEANIQFPEAIKTKALVELFPGRSVDVPLVWQCWAKRSEAIDKLSQAVIKAARKKLRQP